MKYIVTTTFLAALCSLSWLIMGGGFMSALYLYLISGQVTMAVLVGRSYLSFHKPIIQKNKEY